LKIKIKHIAFLFPVLLFSQCEWFSKEEIVEIPDPFFLEALIENGVDTNNDLLISVSEAAAVRSLDIGGDDDFSPAELGEITDLTGLEAFINLDTLLCYANKITVMDISNNKKLKVLNCGFNLLEQLNIASNLEIETLICQSNKIKTLELALNKALSFLNCNDNQLNSLDVTSNINILELNCSYNNLSSIDISNLQALYKFGCNNNHIANLDVSNNANLNGLYCSYNRLSSLNLSKNILLERLVCSANQLSKLNLSNNSKLKIIYIDSMLSLEEVCVWTIPFPPEEVQLLVMSPNVYFTTECTE
jgi:Leucine-rich repeat (LRR) protein